MSSLFFVTHPEVVIDPHRPVPEWPLSAIGRARMDILAAALRGRDIAAIYASGERKAMDGAAILAEALAAPWFIEEALGENDRSSTGYIAPPEFWQVVDAFFANPTRSIRGWERAIDAQTRIVDAVRKLAGRHPDGGDVVIVSHGGVGCLLTAHLQGVAIGEETRPTHAGGGCFLALDRTPMTLRHDWRTIEDGLPT